MVSREISDRFRSYAPAAFCLVCLALCSLAFFGCGTPGAPQPPSLNLPEPVADLTAARAGDSIQLQWTMPKKTLDHLLLKSPVPISICFRENSSACKPAATTSAEPGRSFTISIAVPDSQRHGEPRAASYFVELKSPKGRSAGLSNPAPVVAGQTPGSVVGMTIQARTGGAALQWTGNEQTLVRLHRKLLTPPAPRPSTEKESGAMKPASEPVLQDLLVDPRQSGQTASPAHPQGALDKTAQFGETYEYTAQRLVQIQIQGKTMELAGAISAPIQIKMIDTFPPAIPQGLVAVFVPDEKTIDLSWEPDSDQDLAGYILYRAEATDAKPDWKRVSPIEPIVGTAFRDRTIEIGHSYRYAVTAIDLTGNESKHSSEAQETAPNP